MKFPRTWAQIEAAPWVHSIERRSSFGAWDLDPNFVHVKAEWLPANHAEAHPCSASGYTLKELLSNLREDIWPHLIEPAC